MARLPRAATRTTLYAYLLQLRRRRAHSARMRQTTAERQLFAESEHHLLQLRRSGTHGARMRPTQKSESRHGHQMLQLRETGTQGVRMRPAGREAGTYRRRSIDGGLVMDS